MRFCFFSCCRKQPLQAATSGQGVFKGTFLLCLWFHLVRYPTPHCGCALHSAVGSLCYSGWVKEALSILLSACLWESTDVNRFLGQGGEILKHLPA